MSGRIKLRERIGLCLARWRLRRGAGKLTAAQLLAADWERKSEVMTMRLLAWRKKVLALSESIEKKRHQVASATERLRQTLDAAESLGRQQATVVEALRSENKVLSIEVEALVAANQLALERYKADTAIQAMRQVAARGRETTEA